MEFITLLIFFFFFLLTPLLFLLSNRRRPSNSTIIHGYPIVGNIPPLIWNMRRLLEWTADLIAASPTATVTVTPVILTADPAVIEYISKTNFTNYPKSEWAVKALRDCFGRGIISTNGEEWRVQRKATTYEFTTRSLRYFIHGIVCRKLVDHLFPLLERPGETLDLQETLERFAFDNMCCLMFDEDLNCLDLSSRGTDAEGENLFRAFEDGPDMSAFRNLEPSFWWKIKRFLDVGSERRIRESVDTINTFVKSRLATRRKEQSSSRVDLLSRLAADEANSDQLIRDMIVALVLAGKDTTPCALTWFFWVLSSNKRVVDKILDEIKQIKSRRKADFDDLLFSLEELRDMNYLHAAISELLRLYPPVPLLPRDCSAGEVLPGGTKVGKGMTVMYSAYAMARREELWGKDCAEFRPERWLSEDGVFEAVNPYLFPAFFAGPRMCVGKELAFIQMKAVAAGILERFKVEVMGERGRYHLSIVMKMVGGLPVKISKRIIS